MQPNASVSEKTIFYLDAPAYICTGRGDVVVMCDKLEMRTFLLEQLLAAPTYHMCENILRTPSGSSVVMLSIEKYSGT